MSQISDVKLETWKNLQVLAVKNEAAEAKIALHGAHVLSYVPTGERDVLWMSKESWGEENKPIRGGIPVCWPWFGASKEPAHGLARLAEWKLKETVCGKDGTILRFESFLCGSLQADMTITVGEKLIVELTTTNLGSENYRLTQALHSYFPVSNIKAIEVCGLHGAEFLDTLTSSRHIQDGCIRFGAETDRIYDSTIAECVIEDPAFTKKIHIQKKGSMSTVVWNPWIAKSQRMPDFGNEEFHNMVCVETTNSGNDARILKPGEKHTLSTILFLA